MSWLNLNFPHLHLLLNHIPTVGSVIALAILLLSYARRDNHLKHLGLEVLFIIALLTLPAYMTGVGAHYDLMKMPELSEEAIRVHQDAALVGFTVMEFAAFIGWVGLWQFRRHGQPAPGVVPAATLLLFAALALMGRAATLGGDIRHPEIRPTLAAAADADVDAAGEPAPANGDEAPPNSERFIASAISRVMVYSTWVWPASEAVHFLGLALSFGVLLAVNLRILGVMSQVPFAEVHRLLPWGMLGFGANLITGMLFFVGQPGQYVANGPFFWKIVLLMIAGANFLYLTVFKKAWGSNELGLTDKAMAVGSIAAWFGVLYAGRMLPFIGNSF